jgi:hypothetical protein
MQPAPSMRRPADAVIAAGFAAMAMLLTSLASFGFEEAQGWPIVSAVSICVGLLSVNMTAAIEQQHGASSALGMCGGDLVPLWLKWLTSAAVTSAFAVPTTAWRAGGAAVPAASLWLALASTLCVLLGWWWWQCSSVGQAKGGSGGGASANSPAPAVARGIGGLLALGLLVCLVGALLAPTSSASPVTSPTPAAEAPATQSALGTAAGSDTRPPPPPPSQPLPTGQKVTATAAAEEPAPEQQQQQQAAAAASSDGSDGTITAGVAGCGVAMVAIVGLALRGKGKGGGASSSSYGGSSTGGDELSRELSTEVASTSNPITQQQEQPRQASATV